MQNLIGELDITKIDSGRIDLGTPQWIVSQLYAYLIEQDVEVDISPEEELRLRMVSDAIIAANLLQTGDLPAWTWNLEELIYGVGRFSKEHAARSMPLGVRYMPINQWLVVMLPEIFSEHHAEMLTDVLNDLHNSCSGSAHWVLDMAAVTNLPASLIGYLIGFNHGLRLNACNMVLLWMRQQIVPEALMPPMIKYFSLIKKGAFFLSKGVA
ncbi:MAG: hypothetical protein GX589_07970 [Deltaproteobacteria bacterium]|nr:hypothetical protein [Deltaproteobacteria bacterium]